MPTFIDWFLLSLPLVAAILAVVGDTTDKSRRGWRRLTLVGWISLALAGGAFAAHAIHLREQRTVLEAQEHEQAKLRELAFMRISGSIDRLLGPWQSLYMYLLDTNQFKPGEERQYGSYEEFRDPAFLASVANIDPKTRAAALDFAGLKTTLTWADVFAEAAIDAQAALTEVELTSGDQLAAETKALLERVRKSYAIAAYRALKTRTRSAYPGLGESSGLGSVTSNANEFFTELGLLARDIEKRSDKTIREEVRSTYRRADSVEEERRKDLEFIRDL